MADQTLTAPGTAGETEGVAPQIGGLCVLKGVIIYAATLTFAGFYVYFIVRIFQATGRPPTFDPAMVSAGAALAGVLGSAFALVIGLPTDKNSVNESMQKAIDRSKHNASKPKDKVVLRLRTIFSYEPPNAQSSSWPMSFGIWAYALVASAVAVTYFLNQQETPDTIKTLAVAFAGYVIALLTSVYHLTTNGS